MDFFERQDKARRNTKRLVVYFILAVACIIASIYFVVLLLFQGVQGHRYRKYGEARYTSLWNPALFGYAALGTIGVVVFGSLYKTSALSTGGSAVAESLGGRLLKPNTKDIDERKLRNVVEEMALASGVPVPQIYVMDDEEGINAFAAGHTASDAAIGVTRGCMKLLSRDELQGVIGHEFSHILNGDMRLNLRLIGIIFGIICLTVIGRILLRTRGKNNPLPILGIGLVVIGGLGVLFGKLIQSAVSRQREFLADASAVQFTRNPTGLSSALQKLGGVGSQLESPHAAEASHMFFGNGMGKSFLNMFATHPSLEDRIRAIDPGWDGKFKEVDYRTLQEAPPELQLEQTSPIPFPGFGFPINAAAAAAAAAPHIVHVDAALPNLGQPTALHLRYAEQLRASFPENIRNAAHEPTAAVALVYALLLSQDEAMRSSQLAELAKQTAPAIYERTVALFPEIGPVAERVRLPLVDLALPALRALQPGEFQQFKQTLQWLIESDEQIELFEFILQKIIRRHLEPKFSRTKAPVVQYYTIRPLAPDCGVVLSALAQMGSADDAEVEKAFIRGAPYLRVTDTPIPLLSREQCGLGAIDEALNRLALAVPQIKKNLLEAGVQVIGADGVIQEREAELLRGIADTLDCPMPPFVQVE